MMVMKVRRYADGGKVELPGPETRRVKPTPLPPPKKGAPPKRIKRYADGGKVTSKPPPKPAPRRPAPAPRPPPQPERRASTVDIMRGKTRREQEAALGLKDGGKVKRR